MQEDVIDYASGESVLGYVTWTGDTSSVSLMGDVHDMITISVLGDVMVDMGAANVLGDDTD